MLHLPVVTDVPASTALPPLYARWIDALSLPLPAEPHATCGDCAMRPPDDGDPGDALYFDADSRCCTFAPSLPNFLVGRIVRDASTPATSRDVLRARIAAGVGATPLGVDPTDDDRQRYEALSREGRFGRAPELRCPHLRDDGCGIWAHRNAVCATWYCKHDRGALGMRFWSRVRDLLTVVEARLSRWCALEVGLDDDALATLCAPRGVAGRRRDAVTDPVAAWGAWRGREEAFYAACADRVDTLSWDDVATIIGADVALHLRLLRHARAALDAVTVPGALRRGDVEVTPVDGDAALVHGYSHYDPLVVPRALADALDRGDDVTATIGAAMLRQLTDFEVLVPAE